MKARRDEEIRLKKMSDETVKNYEMYTDVENYVALLSELDAFCNDSITDSVCANNNTNCTCILCTQL